MALLLASACGSEAADTETDTDTDTNTDLYEIITVDSDGGTCTDENAPGYPHCPYGFATNSTIANLSFLGKADKNGSAGTVSYDQLPLNSLDLATYHENSAVKYLVLFAVAGWSEPCSLEQPALADAQKKYESRGVRFLEVLTQGFDPEVGGATEADLDRWQALHDLHFALALDSKRQMLRYTTFYPYRIYVRTSDMKIVSIDRENIDRELSLLTDNSAGR